MTVTTKKPLSGPFVSDGINRNWNFNFKLADVGHLVIIVRNPDSSEGQEITSGISVGSQYLNTDNGGVAVYPAVGQPPITAGKIVFTSRVVPLHQPNRIGNQGRYYPETHEKTFDLLEMQIQQIQEQVDLAIKSAVGTKPPTLIAGSPSNLLYINKNGDLASSTTPPNENILREQGDASLSARLDGYMGDINKGVEAANAAADRSDASAKESEYHAMVSHELVEAAVAGFQGFVDGMGYDFGWINSEMTYFNRDLGTL